MGNFKDRLLRFMYGRYGQDQLYYACLIACLILIIVNTVVNTFIISVLIWGILILIAFRTLSRNVSKRRMENEKFLKLWNPIKGEISLTIRKIKERIDY